MRRRVFGYSSGRDISLRYSKNAHCPPPDAKKNPPTEVNESVIPSGGQNEVVAIGSGSTFLDSDVINKTTPTTATNDAIEIPVMSP